MIDSLPTVGHRAIASRNRLVRLVLLLFVLNWTPAFAVAAPPIVPNGETLKDVEQNLRHGGASGTVHSVSFSSDGQFVVSGSGDNSVRIWNAATGEQVQLCSGHTQPVFSVSFSSDGQFVASGSEDDSVRIWNATTGEQVQLCSGHTDWVLSVSFSSDGQFVASGSFDNNVRIWNAATGEQVQLCSGHTAPVLSVSFSSDGQFVASGSADNSVRICNATTGEQVQICSGHPSTVDSVSFSSDSQFVASGSNDNSVRIWNATTGEQVQLCSGHTGLVNSVSFSSDGQIVASGSNDNSVRIWNAATGEQVQLCSGHTGGVNSVTFSSDRKFVTSGSDDNSVRIWNAATGEQVQLCDGHTNSVRSVSFSSDGQFVASGSDDNSVRMWNAATGKQVQLCSGHTGGIRSVSFSPDGNLVASGSSDSSVRIWNAANGEQVQHYTGHTGDVRSVSFSSDGKFVVSGCNGHLVVADTGDVLLADHRVRIWEVTTGEQILLFGGYGSQVYSVNFSSDGQSVASSWSDRVRIWNAVSGQLSQDCNGHVGTVRSVCFSSDGRFVASGSDDQSVRIWNASTGGQVQLCSGHTNSVRSVSFSSDGQFVASGSSDHSVRIWNAATGWQVERCSGHTDTVMSVSFSSDGNFVASGSSDNSVRIWNVKTKATETLNFPKQSVRPVRTMVAGQRGTWVSFTPDGVVHRYDDGTLLLQRVDRDSIPDHMATGRHAALGFSSYLAPVPPQVENPVPGSLEVTVPDSLVEWSYGNPPPVVVTLRNNGDIPVYWPRIRSATAFPPTTDTFALFSQPPVKAVLQPGESIDVPLTLVPCSRPGNREGWPTDLKLQVDTAFGPIPIEQPIRLEFQTPELVIFAAYWHPSGYERTPSTSIPVAYKDYTKPYPGALRIEFQNVGKVALPAGSKVQAFIHLDQSPMEDLGTFELPRTIAPGSRELVAFTLPGSVSDDFQVEVVVNSREPVWRTWKFPQQQVSRLGARTWLIVGWIAAVVVLLAGGSYLGLFLNPLMREVAADRQAFLRLPVEDVPRATRLLAWTRRLASTLSTVDVAGSRLGHVSDFLDDTDSEHRARQMMERLGWKIDQTIPLNGHGTAFRVLVDEGFVLKLQWAVLLFPEADANVDAAERELRDAIKDPAPPVTLVVTTDRDAQSRWARVSQRTSNSLVTVDSRTLTGWLLSPEPDLVVARLIASQVRVTRFSPYQTSGGLTRSATFFGRAELIGDMLNRELQNYLIVGARQSGKSSLLKEIERQAQRLDLCECHYFSLARTESPAVSLALALGFEGDVEGTDDIALLQQLRRMKRERPLLVLIDEADYFVKSQQENDYRTLHEMRSLSEEGTAYFILAGFWTLYASAALDYQSPLRNWGEVVEIGPLDTADCHDMITQPMRGLGLTFEHDADHQDEGAVLLERIIAATGQRANLIATTCSEIIRLTEPGDQYILADHVQQALSSRAIRERLSGWESVTGVERDDQLDRIVIYATIDAENFTQEQLLETLHGRDVDVPIEDLRRSLRRLELAYIVLRDGSTFRFCVPLLVELLREEGTVLSLNDECNRWRVGPS